MQKKTSIHIENKGITYVLCTPSIGVMFGIILSMFSAFPPCIADVLRAYNMLATCQIYVLHMLNTLHICCTYIVHTSKFSFLGVDKLTCHDVSDHFICFSYALCHTSQCDRAFRLDIGYYLYPMSPVGAQIAHDMTTRWQWTTGIT